MLLDCTILNTNIHFIVYRTSHSKVTRFDLVNRYTCSLDKTTCFGCLTMSR